MSEKRFVYEEEHYNFPIKKRIRDTQNNETYINLKDVCEMLNEQQVTISALKEENEELKRKLKDCEHEHFLDSMGGSNKWFGMGGF